MGAAITKKRVAELLEAAVDESDEAQIELFTRGLEQARVLWPTDADALADDMDLTHWRMNLAVSLQQAERWTEMRDVMQELLAQYPSKRAEWYETSGWEEEHTETDALCWYAISLQHCGDLAEALRVIDSALERFPDHADSHHERACILHMMGNKPAALAAIKTAIDLDGDDRRESIREDTDFASLVGDPEFDALTAKPTKKAKKRR
jgi:tetratricopeptide (TPR) repeat protein